MEVENLLQVKLNDPNDKENMPIIKNWLSREGLQFIQNITKAEKEACKSTTGLFNGLKEKFKPQNNEMILSLQYCKLHNPYRSGWVDSI